jgi:thymidylate synthase (FAD)
VSDLRRGEADGGGVIEDRINVLDHGYVELIEQGGSDERIIEAARMSTGKGFLGWGTSEKPGDEKLLAFLWRNQHSTPFEMGDMTFEVYAPIFVFREWHRHRTQSFNELSARYTQMPDVHYVPSLNRINGGLARAGANRQAQGVAPLAGDGELLDWLQGADAIQDAIYAHYEKGLSLGIPKEIARINTPVARYSKMRAKANLLNWTKFLRLRLAPNAQWEIRQYACAVDTFMRRCFPRTAALFHESDA